MQKKNLPINGAKGYLKLSEKGFTIKFKHFISATSFRLLSVGKTLRKVEFITTQDKIVVNNIFLGNYSPPEFTGSISSFHSKGFSKKRKFFYKLIIPLAKKLDFFFQVEQTRFTTDLGVHSRTSTKATINGIEIIACTIELKEKGRRYLSIECRTFSDFESFSDSAHDVKNALGYLTGYLAGKHGYYFAFTDEEMRVPKHYFFSEMRGEIRSGYSPIYSNPHGYIRNTSVADRYYKKKLLRELSLQEFSILCQRLRDDIEFTSVILLILESSVASLIFMPGGFAIALEMLSDIIVGDQKMKLNPVQDSSISNSIRKECLEVLSKYQSSITPEAFGILTNKINALNQITNKARLKAPFELLKIDLLPRDLEILETRNDFLHGRVPDITKAGPNRPLDRVNRDLYYSAMRLFTLLNIIILKWIGYDNRVVNHPKIQEDYCKIKLREEPYRVV